MVTEHVCRWMIVLGSAFMLACECGEELDNLDEIERRLNATERLSVISAKLGAVACSEFADDPQEIDLPTGHWQEAKDELNIYATEREGK